MKRKLVLTSKIALVVLVVLLLAVCMIMAYDMDGNITGLPALVLIPFVIAMIVNGILFAIEVVLEIRESWKDSGSSGILRILREGIISALVFFAYDLIRYQRVAKIQNYIIGVTIVIVLMTVINYWKRIKKEKI